MKELLLEAICYTALIATTILYPRPLLVAWNGVIDGLAWSMGSVIILVDWLGIGD